MSGSQIGGLKAARTNKERYGNNYYAEIGAKGGRNGHTGGFAYNRELARKAGALGGSISKRGKKINLDEEMDNIEEMFENGYSVNEIAKKYGVSGVTMRRYMVESAIIKSSGRY